MLKRSLLTSVAAMAFTGQSIAADLPVNAPPPPTPYNWAGFYLGGQIGYGWGEDSGNVSIPGPLGATPFPNTTASTSTQTQGVVGGAHIGNNWQINQFVLGLEGDVDGTSLSKSTLPVFGLGYNVKTSLPIQGVILGRVGYAFDRTLLYVTGGVGYAPIQNKYSLLGNDNDFSTARSFWTVGGGIEYAIDDNWSVRAEYRYSDLGFLSDGPIVFNNIVQSHHWTENQVQVGFSYRWPLAASAAALVTK